MFQDGIFQWRPRPQRRMLWPGFSLVELLVCIGIISVLIGILLPVLSKARRQAAMVRELAASRQLMQAYTLYAEGNRGWLIAGHINENVSLNDDQGIALSPPEVVKRWPWRLASYIRYHLNGTLLVGERAEALADRKMPMWSYMVSLTPSFGMNFFNLGGDRTNEAANLPGYAKKNSQVPHSSRMIVFASARFPEAEGYFKIVPPTKSFEYSAHGWSTADYCESGEPAAWGYVHPRHNGRAVVACFDGHSELLSINELRDMTRWCNQAAIAGNTNWVAP